MKKIKGYICINGIYSGFHKEMTFKEVENPYEGMKVFVKDDDYNPGISKNPQHFVKDIIILEILDDGFIVYPEWSRRHKCKVPKVYCSV